MRAETSRLIALTFLPRARVLKLGPVLQLLHALGELLDCLNCGDDARQRLQHTIARLAFTLCINGEPRKQEAVVALARPSSISSASTTVTNPAGGC